ncbi:MAG: hypothetical protein F4Y94_11430, partial [Chloroflexi bacterium]|nr:hypothetical protein [Chloroflexota bacterium]
MLMIRDGRQRALALLAPVTGLLVLLAVLLTGTTDVRADATCSVPPVNLTSALSDDGTAVVLTWQASPDCTPDVYEIHRRDMDVDGSRMTKIDSVDGDVLTYTDTTVGAGQVYRYKIRSNDLGSRSGRTEITIPEATAGDPTPAPSQPSITSRVEPRADVSLVTNFGAGGVSVTQSVAGYAQRFTTGSSPAGYTLSAVEVKFDTGNEFTLSVCTVVAGDNTPTTTCWDFTAPSSFDDNSTVSFTAPSTMADLDPATSYSVVIEPKVTNQTFGMAVTSQNTEDSGGAAGWTIADGSHILSGGSWTSQSNVMRIKVKGAVLNSEPTFDDSPPVTRDADEDVAAGTAIGMPVSATDDDGDTLHYELSPASATFSVDSATGQIRTASGVTLDHETSDSHTVTIRVRDGFDDDRDADTDFDASVTVTINVVDLDEPATVSLTPSSGPYELGVQITATPTDEDDDFMVDSYQWARGATQTGTFTDISGATNMMYTPTEDDINNFLRVTVQYDDTHGDDKQITATTDTKVVLGNVEPEFSLASTTRSVAENTAANMNVGAPVSTTDGDGDTLEYRLTGTDAGSFTIETASGQIKTSGSLNFESKASYEVVVEVRDKKDSTGAADTAWDDTIDVTINLDNVDEPGTVTITGAESGGETLTASVTDPDGTVSNLTWQWARDASPTGAFAMTISGATSATYRTVVADVNRYLRAKASYTDPQGAGKSATSVPTGQISASNAEPEFPSSETGARSVPENSADRTAVGDPVAAEDDDGDMLHYSLSSDGAASFTIDSATGQIRTKMGVTYDFEGTAFFAFSVYVRDSKNAASDPDMATDDTINVTVSLTDVNERPAIMTPQTAISVQENQTSVLTYAATDPDNNGEANDSANTLTWSVESADDGGFFEIDAASGVLTFKNAPNFEDKQDAGADNVYNVTVTVTDNGVDGARGASNHLSISKSLAVTVTDVNETPTLTTAPTAPSFDENGTGVVATYVATDPDATLGTMSWDLLGNDAGDFNITSTVNGTAELTFKSPPDFENPDDTGTNNVYDLTVRVRDNATPPLEDSQIVQVRVNDLNETPVVSGDASPDFQEIDFSRVPGDIPPSDYVITTFTAYDDDDDTVSWSVAGDDAAHFSIGASTGALSFDIAAVTHPQTGELTARPDFERPNDANGNNEYVIEVRADDQQGESNSVGTFAVTVTVTGLDEIPVLISGDLNPTFAEIEYDAGSWDSTVEDYRGYDEEGETVFYHTTHGLDSGDFQLVDLSVIGDRFGRLRFIHRPDFENPADSPESGQTEGDNVYKVTMRLRDDAGGTPYRSYSITVTVTNVDETPEILPLPNALYDEIEYDAGVALADIDAVATFTARDEEGEVITWELAGPDADDFTITKNADGRGVLRFASLPDFEQSTGSGATSNIYQLIILARDANTPPDNTDENVGQFGEIGDEFLVQVDDVNERPEFTGSPSATLAYDEHDATLDANFQEPPYAFPVIGSYTARDEEGFVDWSLEGPDRLDFTIDSGGAVTFNSTPNFEDPDDANGDNVYQYTVVATDRESGTTRRAARHEVTLTVQDLEETGAISVSNLNPAVGESVTFMISDPDGGIVLDQLPGSGGFAWVIQTRTSGGAWQQLIHSNTGLASYTYVADEDETDLQLRAIVNPYTDRRGGGKSAESEVTAAITPDPIVNAPPRIRQGSAQNVPETGAGENIGERVTATDRDNDPLTFAIGEGADGALFEIHPTSGQLRTVQALDFETTTGLLLVPVNVSDGKDAAGTVETERVADATTTVSIRVLDVEEEGVVTLSDPEPGVGTTVQASLSDGDGSISGRSWRWWRSRDGRTAWTPIPGTTSSSSTSSYTTVLADAGFYLRAAVGYTDNRGGGKRAEGITALRVFGENQQPTFPTAEDGERTVPENSSPGTSVGAPVAAQDPENDRLTYLLSGTDAASFSIVAGSGQLRVKEPLDFETKSSYEVTVDVHDGKDGLGNASAAIDDSIDVTITVGNVEEPGSVTLTTLTATIQARVEVAAVLEDDDGPASVRWAWARSPNGRTQWVNLVGVTGSRYTPTLVDAGSYIRATASYSDGHGSNKSAAKVSPRVGDPPPVNSAPAFPVTEDGRRDVPEDASGGDRIGDPVAANDVNFDSLTYSLSGTDAASFEIDASSGQLRLASGVSLDFEGKRTYRLTVSVSDGADQNDDPDDVIDDTISVVVSVTNVNEAPVLSGDTTPSVSENSSAAVATYTAADPERDTIEWSVNNTNFWISSRGQLYFATPPDYEDGATSFSITVTATDPGGLAGRLDV